ncbi:hypothetical protein [Flammeovirga aprica]|uniref:Uncharacterized protein n=1 Tax=Flammeovirga aprica JL-4 TaxID=694437 RepID=A0A7X9RS26_9BACT|nr:hypothetical protein [Flammeovirga aprica]NME66765.1 hypothetical protein [Flammeovirga aprica JL-4]
MKLATLFFVVYSLLFSGLSNDPTDPKILKSAERSIDKLQMELTEEEREALVAISVDRQICFKESKAKYADDKEGLNTARGECRTAFEEGVKEKLGKDFYKKYRKALAEYRKNNSNK